MKKESQNKILIVTLYAIAMGFLESAVVIYLRKLYYPFGFSFPLKGFIEPTILGVEWIREFATIVMLLTISMLAAKKFYPRFAYFLYAFAIWDIFYYVFLKVYLNWPSSLLESDILFLIPWPWVGPVLAPILCTILMISAALIIIYFEDNRIKVKFILKEWLLIILGILLVLYTWVYDYGKIIIAGGFLKDFFSLIKNQQFFDIVENYVPQPYNWAMFIIGLLFSTIGIILFYIRTKKLRKN